LNQMPVCMKFGRCGNDWIRKINSRNPLRAQI
jgi:hypothetical protein